jgi:glycosyltransferase involved in cell wall biosynthesis
MISIAIPTFEANGNGWLYLSELLNTISKQTFKDYEVVISDQSSDDKVKQLCNFYSNIMNLNYFDSTHINKGNATNTNYAISKCKSDKIKIIFQDDIFVDDKAMEYFNECFENNSQWIVCGSFYCKNLNFIDNPMVPKYHDDIWMGNNTISSPSVLAFKGKHYLDENLTLLVDCDLYKRLYDIYGMPTIIENPLVCNRMHKNQMAKKYWYLLPDEISYLKKKYKETHE